ncbi:hypothetical protein [Bacteroides fragilis]|uniref:hypothetical protein n=1 Tax=Bacteroides fragilis TaxID=817 RepID=UPI00101B93E4|nr:hypothetical protein [Bacteroides fragilis]
MSFRCAENGLICRGKNIFGFKNRGEDSVWKEAKAKIVRGTLIVSAFGVKRLTKVFYCFDEAMVAIFSVKKDFRLLSFGIDRGF